LVLIENPGKFPSIWLDRSIMQELVNIPYLSRLSNVIVVTIKLDLG
jgi:hypothetical protein